MVYLKLYWIHKKNNLPYIIYSELDEDRFEVRKVYIYKDSKMLYVSKIEVSSSSIFLSDQVIPQIDIIERSGNIDNIFKASIIKQSQFEDVWNKAIEQN